MTIALIINNSKTLMSQERNLNYLINNRIVYKRDPVGDEPSKETKHYKFYENGTYECYRLFNSKAKINTYKSLKWHLLVLWHLNPELTEPQFRKIAIHISQKSNGFTTFVIKDGKLDQIIEDIKELDIDQPPKNRLRKIIFKDNCGLDRIEKLTLVGQILGKTKQASESDIYEAMLCINEDGKKITVSSLAKYLKVSTRTIFRNITEELREEKQKLNNEILQHSKLRSIQERAKPSIN